MPVIKECLPVSQNTAANPTSRSRIASRTFPSAFQAWSPADNLKSENPWATLARHDLVFHGPTFMGLRWDDGFIGLARGFLKESIPPAVKLRGDLLRKNPNLILLAEIRYRDAPRSYLPPDHSWWKRQDGTLVMGWEEGGFLQLDFANPEFRRQVARQAKAVMDSGVFDGVMLDWWIDDDNHLALVKAVRAEVGDEALILVNANDRTFPKTAPFINGSFMECTQSRTPQDWKQIADTLQWAEIHLKEPRINCLETWFHASRQDLHLMRATTTLALTLSDGYCLFSDPNPLPTPDHLHDWYEFWNKSLGRPKAPGVKMDDGSFQREFNRGTAVYNPLANKLITVTFDKPRTRASTRQEARSFTVPPGDGDLFLVPNAK
jgi:hypothetical protein